MSLIVLTKELEKIKNIEGFEKVKFIILFGSAAEGRMMKGSDVDLCMYYDGSSEEASRFRFKVLSELFNERYDVHIFQQLPVYVQIEALKGRVMYCRDTTFLYEVATETINDFESFKHRLDDYIGERAIT
jgi:predicted nucleotidyltransferase